MAPHHILLLLIAYAHAQTQPRKCHDVSQAACAKFLAKNPDMCKNDCLAKVCQDTCRFCPVTCYHCDEVSTPEQCNKTMQCDTTNQRCIAAQRYGKDFHKFFTSGCTERELCSALFGFRDTKREVEVEVGERSYHMQGGCCDYNLCNIHDPENVTATPDPSSRPPKPTGPNPLLSNKTAPTFDHCKNEDLDTEGCRLLNETDPTICQNNCLATQFCPRFCGTCTECYDCPKSTDPLGCNNKKICKVNQSCVSVATLGADLSVTTQLGCMDDRVCALYFSGAIGKRQTTLKGSCCKTDLCNKVDASAAPLPPLVG